MKKLVIVLTTSQIFYHGARSQDEEPVIVIGDAHFYSTGRLERACKEGHEVYVVSSRSGLSPQDEWWLPKIPKDHIFLADPAVKNSHLDDEAFQRLRLEPWRRLFEHLRLPFPENCERVVMLMKRLEDFGLTPGYKYRGED